MGLFSFLKKAGSNTLSKSSDKSAPAARTVLDEAADRADKINKLREHILALNLEITDMSLEIVDDKVTVYGTTQSQAMREKVILAIGNVEGVATVDDRISVVIPEPEAQFYEVQAGDSLSKISKKYYGDAMKYNVIFEANTPLLTHPDKIYPGQVLRIPNLS
jgi:nucleoid-associated protein YgaU